MIANRIVIVANAARTMARMPFGRRSGAVLTVSCEVASV